MKALRPSVIALIAAAALAAPAAANAATTTNYSDQWWIQNESGWGASVLQQADILFIDLFVYGPDAKPVWYTGAAHLQAGSPAGHNVFAGDLYATTGPYFGLPTFDGAQVTRRIAGTLTFDADSPTTARLAYSVDGTQVVKFVTRQWWKDENLAGSYRGGYAWDTTCAGQSEHEDDDVQIAITHSPGNVVTMSWRTSDQLCTITGQYEQSGHVGRVANATANCPATIGDPAMSGTLDVFEIERTETGISFRITGTVTGGGATCTIANGRAAAVRR